LALATKHVACISEVFRNSRSLGREKVRSGSGQDFSNSGGCRAGLKFMGVRREWTKTFNPSRTLVYFVCVNNCARNHPENLPGTCCT